MITGTISVLVIVALIGVYVARRIANTPYQLAFSKAEDSTQPEPSEEELPTPLFYVEEVK